MRSLPVKRCFIVRIRTRASAPPLSLQWKTREFRGFALSAMALLAMSLALILSPSGMRAWAWYQSPLSPVSLPPTQALQAPTLPAVTPTSVPEPSSNTGTGRVGLIAGGVILAGLLVGAAALLQRGQPPDEPTP